MKTLMFPPPRHRCCLAFRLRDAAPATVNHPAPPPPPPPVATVPCAVAPLPAAPLLTLVPASELWLPPSGAYDRGRFAAAIGS